MRVVSFKIPALLLVGFVLLGTVVADRVLHGPTTAGYGRELLAGSAVAIAFTALGLWAARRHRTFFGFSQWQWGLLTIASFGGGAAARVFLL